MQITIDINDKQYDALAQSVEEFGLSTDPGGANEGDEQTYSVASDMLTQIRRAMIAVEQASS